MKMNGEQMDVIRAKARKLLDEYVPFKWGDAHSKEICPGYSPGFGTTCGFLCHWLMWRLGVKDASRVNWTDEKRGLKAMPGDNIKRIYKGGEAPFIRCASYDKGISIPNPMTTGARPRTGDIVFLYRPGGVQADEHVFVFISEERIVDEVFWNTAEAGQPGANNLSTDARFRKRRILLPKQPTPGALKPDPAAYCDEVKDPDFAVRRSANRTIIGWLDLGNLDYTDDAFELALKGG